MLLQMCKISHAINFFLYYKLGTPVATILLAIKIAETITIQRLHLQQAICIKFTLNRNAIP